MYVVESFRERRQIPVMRGYSLGPSNKQQFWKKVAKE